MIVGSSHGGEGENAAGEIDGSHRFRLSGGPDLVDGHNPVFVAKSQLLQTVSIQVAPVNASRLFNALHLPGDRGNVVFKAKLDE